MKHPLKPMFILIQMGIPCKWIYDSQRFLLESFDLISSSPSHIYHSALPFAPSSSWLHKCYTAQLLQEVKVVGGLPAGWGTCSRTVALSSYPMTLACWNDTIGVSCQPCDIIILNAITGGQVAVLSEHTDWVRSLTFSSDGMLLVSGSDDRTVKLWDVQTGGVIKTLRGHVGWVFCLSITPDGTTLASGASDSSIRLWDVQSGACFHVIDAHTCRVNSISFSPTNPQHLISAAEDHTVKWWDVNCCKIEPAYEGDHVVFSLDGTQFVSWKGEIAIVRDSKSGVAVVNLLVSGYIGCCCFSPSGKSLAGSTGQTIYIWDISCSNPHLLKTFVGHTDTITGLIFSSSLVSVSEDKSVKFWQIDESPTGPITTDAMSTPPTSASIESVSLQSREGIAISGDSGGVVKTWDILTGLCRASFKTPAGDHPWRDAQLIEGRLILVWYAEKKIHIWDTEKEELIQTMNTPESSGLRISGDGSKVFCLAYKSIQSWSMWTGEVVGEVELEGDDNQYLDPLHADDSRIWVQYGASSIKGWDFGPLNSSPIPLSSTFPNRPHLDFIFCREWVDTDPSRMEDTITGKEVFQLVGRYAKPLDAKWDGRYLVAGYRSGEVLILDFNKVGPQ